MPVKPSEATTTITVVERPPPSAALIFIMTPLILGSTTVLFSRVR